MKQARRSPAIAFYAVFAAAGLLGPTPARSSTEIAIKAGCIACHLPDKKLVGPSWHDIAAKYRGKADAPALLAGRVKKGGKDVWGPVPMPPANPKAISDAETKAMIAWVLKTP